MLPSEKKAGPAHSLGGWATFNNCLPAHRQVTIAKLRQELDERDTVMADNYSTIQMLRRQLQDLEKHKFVLSYRVGEEGCGEGACSAASMCSAYRVGGVSC
jgi:hypothetical protein